MKRRLISVLAVLALGAAALAGAAPATASEPDGTAYVALGDSQAAGTGNLPYIDSTCLVSKKSYPMLLAATLATPFVTNACAGATTQNVIDGQLGDLGPSTQLVTITAGINNLGWQAVLAACADGGDPVACDAAMAASTTALNGLPFSTVQLVALVRAWAPNALILVTGYPLPFGSFTGSCSVGALNGVSVKFSAQQAAEINAGMAGVNAAVQAGVAGYVGYTGDPAVRFVDIATGFAGHGLCDTATRWISGFVSGGPVDDRGFHPTAAGQQAFARILAGELAP